MKWRKEREGSGCGSETGKVLKEIQTKQKLKEGDGGDCCGVTYTKKYSIQNGN